jgi:hypothetical protein
LQGRKIAGSEDRWVGVCRVGLQDCKSFERVYSVDIVIGFFAIHKALPELREPIHRNKRLSGGTPSREGTCPCAGIGD